MCWRIMGQIKPISKKGWIKYKFRKLLKKKVYDSAFTYLMEKKRFHSKMFDTEYRELEIQTFLKSNSGLTNDEKHFLIKFRLRMASLRKKLCKPIPRLEMSALPGGRRGPNPLI